MVSLMRRLITTSRLTIFIIVSTFLIMVLSMLLAGMLYYFKSADSLEKIYSEKIVQNLEQINQRAHDQVAIIDSVYTQLMSNTLIRENLDPATAGHQNARERKLEIERQLGYVMANNYLWNEQLLNGVYILDSSGGYSGFSMRGTPDAAMRNATEIAMECDQTAPTLQIRTRDGDDDSIYFTKNVMSMYTGYKIAMIVIDLNKRKWMQGYSAGTDENWLILLHKHGMLLTLGADSDDSKIIEAVLSATKSRSGFQEIQVENTSYFAASQTIDTAGLTSIVAAPKGYLLHDLGETLSSFIANYALIALVTMFFTVLTSVFATSPIRQMIAYVRDVSIRDTDAKRPKARFKELDEFVDVFHEMLVQLQQYYNDLHEQRVLLKNAEIEALQAQINPHFLFNVLNTIAWKAEIGGNSDVYKMVLSLGELLRANTLAKGKDFVTIKEELEYTWFYIYLQQQRFEGKISVKIDNCGVPEQTLVPRLCIQPLVENAILHGFEPLPDSERDWLLTVHIAPERDGIRVQVRDNGIGFPDDFDLDSLTPDEKNRHTYVGLKNLDRRLVLMGGSENHLVICNEHRNTVVSFWLPEKGENE